ncbi:hypothetical protein Tco_1283305 [Tanacetum coccineum]
MSQFCRSPLPAYPEAITLQYLSPCDHSLTSLNTFEDTVHDDETHECTFQSSYFQWTPIQDTSRLVRGNDYCKLRYHLLSESKSKVLVPSFWIFICGIFSGHHSFHVAPGDLISISKSQSLNISVPPG